jgi:hypothetical protein
MASLLFPSETSPRKTLSLPLIAMILTLFYMMITFGNGIRVLLRAELFPLRRIKAIYIWMTSSLI